MIERIKTHVNVPWSEQTVDTFKAGDPDTPVTGIAVTMMATFDVIQRAAAAGQNLVITHEPTFYGHQDEVRALEREQDAVYKAKIDFITAHHMVVWRFHDFWHRRTPDGILTGMVKALGWESYQKPDAPEVFAMPETTLETLAANIRQKLDARTLRVVGDPVDEGVEGRPGARLRRLRHEPAPAAARGRAGGSDRRGARVGDRGVRGRRHDGQGGKALIVIGHIPSEQAGMDECTRWLKTFVTEVPVEFVPAKQAFWMPAHNASRPRSARGGCASRRCATATTMMAPMMISCT